MGFYEEQFRTRPMICLIDDGTNPESWLSQRPHNNIMHPGPPGLLRSSLGSQHRLMRYSVVFFFTGPDVLYRHVLRWGLVNHMTGSL